MPLFALAVNFAWELVYALYVAESPLEQAVFSAWLCIDCVIVAGVMKHAKAEWRHAPAIARHMGSILLCMIGVATLGHWSFAKWWLDNAIGKREGKFYRGAIGPDTTELGFWSAAFCQVHLSAASLCQLCVRKHSRGVSWGIWYGFFSVYVGLRYFARELISGLGSHGHWDLSSDSTWSMPGTGTSGPKLTDISSLRLPSSC